MNDYQSIRVTNLLVEVLDTLYEPTLDHVDVLIDSAWPGVPLRELLYIEDIDWGILNSIDTLNTNVQRTTFFID